MSQEVISQKIQRTCEGCGTVKEWELVGMGEDAVTEMEQWYTIIREVFFDGRFQKIMVQACCLGCLPAAGIKLALPKVAEEEQTDNIDLDSLRTERIN